LHAFWAEPDGPRDLQYPLRAHLGSGRVGGARDPRVDNDLHDPRTIPQVEEGQPAVIPASIDPPGQPDLLAGVFSPQLSASVRLKHVSSQFKEKTPPGG
jgi:hypothetical protein